MLLLPLKRLISANSCASSWVKALKCVRMLASSMPSARASRISFSLVGIVIAFSAAR